MINSGKEAVGGGKGTDPESTVHVSLSSHSTGMEFLKWAVQDLAPCGLWVCTMTLGLGVEMKGVLFVFGITSYIPIHLEEREGEILQPKMPYTVTRNK